MLYRREGYPEVDELVLCTVTKIFHHSIFVNLDEYDRSGMVHISEVAPGRIRNLRDYVVPGKKIVCKVLKIDTVKEHIDLSYRRVNESEKKKKVEEIKQEQKAEKILEMAARKLKVKKEALYEEVTSKVFESYVFLHLAFKDFAVGKIKLEDLKIPKKIISEISDLIIERFKPQIMEIKGVFDIHCYAEEGVEIIKKVLTKVQKDFGVDLFYLGGGSYQLKIRGEKYKDLEAKLKKIESQVITSIKKAKGEATFKR